MLLDLRVQGMTAPSGMRRLMLYQLQEEMLQKDKERKEAKPVAVVEQAVKPKVTRPTKHTTKVEAVVEPERVVYPFKKIERPTEPSVYEQLIEIPVLTYFSVEIARTSLIIDLEVERRKRAQKTRRRAAAFLLLAA